MNREIKFRAWARRSDEWEEDGEKRKFIMINADSLAFEQYLPLCDLIKDINDDFYSMQYTGLKDKNGKEIYEGDILQSHIDAPYHKVFWSINDCGWKIICITNNHIYPMSKNVFEIVGNIYEHPHLNAGSNAV